MAAAGSGSVYRFIAMDMQPARPSCLSAAAVGRGQSPFPREKDADPFPVIAAFLMDPKGAGCAGCPGR